MTGGTVGGEDNARRMNAIATGLVAAGLAAAVYNTRGVLDVTATLDRPGKATEVIVDEDGYVEIRYWNDPDATPEQVTAVITGALAAIAVTQRP
jgi:hypothetical protein